MQCTICIFICVLWCGNVFSDESVRSALTENSKVLQKHFKMSCSLKEEPEEGNLHFSGNCKEQATIDKLFKMECKLVEVCSNGTKGCADGWIQFQDSCYLLWNKTTLNFQNAAAMCGQNGAHLVFVETEAENSFLKQKLRSLPSAHWWMGITDLEKEGTWKYYGTNKTISFADWRPEQPDNDGGNENCGHFWNAGFDHKWNDFHCSHTIYTICEKKIQ